MRTIDADTLNSIKFHHSLHYTHITPSDVDAESYKRGWNDAIDSIVENAPTIEPEIYYGYTPTYGRPLGDREIVPRLRDIQKQVGGSYAIDRAIEIIEAVAERRTDEDD